MNADTSEWNRRSTQMHADGVMAKRLPRYSSRATRYALLALLLGLAVFAAVAGLRTWSAVGHLRAARALATADLNLASAVAACTEVEAAYEDVAFLLPLAHVAGIVPDARAQVAAQAPALGRAAYHGCRGLAAANRLMSAASAESGAGAGTRLLVALRGNQRDAHLAGTSLSTALDAIEQVDIAALRALPELRPVADGIELAREHAAELRQAAKLAPVFPELANRLLGGDRPRTYILVGQNNDEVRATGGYWGTLGLLTVAEGRVINTDVRSSDLWDNPSVPKLPAPEPLQKYMNFGGWYLRDANWWVDFRRSAVQLLLMWDREWGNAGQIDGVIAIDNDALERLLRALGGVDVPELGGHVAAETAIALLNDRREQCDDPCDHAAYHRVKTEALSALQRATLQKATGVQGSAILRLLGALDGAGRDKHLLIWLRDPELQALVSERGWDGRIDPGKGDFLGVVDTTLSYSKMGPYIQRNVSYTRQPDGTSLVEITYTNTYQPRAAFDIFAQGIWWDWRTGLFRQEQGTWLNYARVLGPEHAQLREARGWDDVPVATKEGNVAVFGAPLLLRPGETRTVSLTYSNLTPSGAPQHYRQPGAATLTGEGRNRR